MLRKTNFNDFRITSDGTGQVKVRMFDFSGLVTSESKISMLCSNKVNESAWIVSFSGATRISFRGGGQSSGSGPLGITGPASPLPPLVWAPVTLCVRVEGGIRPPGVWLLFEPEATLCILLSLQVQS